MQLPKGVTDSKKVTEKKREALFAPLCFSAFDYGIGHAWPEEIDKGPYAALQLSYKRAIEDLDHVPDLLIVDGKNKVSGCTIEQLVEPKADLNHRQVSVASLIAKVFRDKIMTAYSRRFPEYRWSKNKGYGSFDHEQAILKHGIVSAVGGGPDFYIHRKMYCRKFLVEGEKQWREVQPKNQHMILQTAK